MKNWLAKWWRGTTMC